MNWSDLTCFPCYTAFRFGHKHSTCTTSCVVFIWEFPIKFVPTIFIEEIQCKFAKELLYKFFRPYAAILQGKGKFKFKKAVLKLVCETFYFYKIKSLIHNIIVYYSVI